MEIRVLDFTAKWCSTCQALDKVLEKEVIPKYQDKIEFIKIDVEEDEKMIVQHNILSVPTLIFLSGSVEIARLSAGITNEKVIKKLDSMIN